MQEQRIDELRNEEIEKLRKEIELEAALRAHEQELASIRQKEAEAYDALQKARLSRDREEVNKQQLPQQIISQGTDLESQFRGDISSLR
jgi:hypothetical protein